MYNEINELQQEILDGTVLPDLKRLYLCDQLIAETDATKQKLLQALLAGYDTGKIDIVIDPWDRTIKYVPADIN